MVERIAMVDRQRDGGRPLGDVFTSLIRTCQLSGVDPFHYLTELQKHAAELAANPRDWMP